MLGEGSPGARKKITLFCNREHISPRSGSQFGMRILLVAVIALALPATALAEPKTVKPDRRRDRPAPGRVHPGGGRAEGSSARLGAVGRRRPDGLARRVDEGQHVRPEIPCEGHDVPRLDGQLLLSRRRGLRHPPAADDALARRLVLPRGGAEDPRRSGRSRPGIRSQPSRRRDARRRCSGRTTSAAPTVPPARASTTAASGRGCSRCRSRSSARSRCSRSASSARAQLKRRSRIRAIERAASGGRDVARRGSRRRSPARPSGSRTRASRSSCPRGPCRPGRSARSRSAAAAGTSWMSAIGLHDGVVERDAEHLLVRALLVGHVEDAHGAHADAAARERRLADEHERVERVAVLGQRALDVAVVGRVAHRGEEPAVERDPAELVVPLVLVPRAGGDLHEHDAVHRR